MNFDEITYRQLFEFAEHTRMAVAADRVSLVAAGFDNKVKKPGTVAICSQRDDSKDDAAEAADLVYDLLAAAQTVLSAGGGELYVKLGDEMRCFDQHKSQHILLEGFEIQ